MDTVRILFGKRKFTVAMVALIMTFVLALLGVVDGTQWSIAMPAIVGLYGGAEAWEGIGHAKHGA